MSARITWAVGGIAALILVASGNQGASIVGRASASALALAGIVVLTGWSGQLNLHVAAVGIGFGAYAAAGLSAVGAPGVVAVLAAPLLASIPAVLLGVGAIRFRGLELAIATLAAGFVCEQGIFPALGRALARGGSETALALVPRPGFALGDASFALFALLFASLGLGAAAWAGARAGSTLRAVRDREVLAEARGVPVAAWRLGAFVVSVALGAAGGAIGAAQTGVVTPDAFGLTLSLQVLAVAIVCGVERLDRVVVGAALLAIATEAAAVPGLSWIAGDRADLVFGVGLIVVLARRARVTATARPAAPGPAAAPVVVGAAVLPLGARAHATALRVEGVDVQLGGRAILTDVSLRVDAGEVVGLVGGNGAGKTTLLNVITGLVAPQLGAVFLGNADLTLAAPHRRARLGLSRTFQGGALFPGPVLDVVAAAVRSRARAERALAEAGAAHLASSETDALGLGDARLVEIATVLATDPIALLLDEPLAGLDSQERERVVAAIDAARVRGIGVLVIEHDHTTLARVADRTYELTAGVIAERSREVRRAARA